MFYIYLIVFVACAPLIWWLLLLRKFKALDHIPGPKPLPIIGNALEMGTKPQELLKNCFTWTETYGDMFKIYLANEVRVFVTKPEIIEQLLSSNIHITKSGAYDLFKEWLGDGLLMSKGLKWKIRRKMITPTFHFKILDQFLNIFNTAGNLLVKILEKEIGKDSIDIFTFINLYSLDIICETAMGVKYNLQENCNREYADAVRGMLDISIIRVFSITKKFDILFQFSKDYKKYQKYLQTLHNFTINVIMKKRQEKAKVTQETTADDGIKRKIALLDLLLESEDANLLTNEDIREEIDTFMFEGHDTTTSGIAFAILALADHPDIQERVYEEIVSEVGEDKNAQITMQHLQNVQYLDLVIKEAQRVYPSVPLIERRLEEDFTCGNYCFPKDTFISLFIYGLHHSEKYFSNPEIFDPNRFLPQNKANIQNFAYIPFSAGPRNCIGQKFAILEMKCTIIKMVRNFRILPVPNYKPDLGMAAILKSYNGVNIRLEKR